MVMAGLTDGLCGNRSRLIIFVTLADTGKKQHPHHHTHCDQEQRPERVAITIQIIVTAVVRIKPFRLIKPLDFVIPCFIVKIVHETPYARNMMVKQIIIIPKAALSQREARRNCVPCEDAGYPQLDGKTPWSFTVT